MSETPKERRKRLVNIIETWDSTVDPNTDRSWPYESLLDALLDALEPPVAEMVRRGIEELTVSVVETEESTVHLVHMYRPRSEA